MIDYLKKRRIYKMFKKIYNTTKKQAEDCKNLLPAAVYIFKAETGSCDPVSDCFFVTVLTPALARTLLSSAEPPIESRLRMPAIRAGRKPLRPLFQAVRAVFFVAL